jgi:6-phosphogluconolactonase
MEMANTTLIEIQPDLPALSRAAADRIVQAACRSGDRFSMALSGGSTPRETYALLATDPYRAAIDWSRVHIFWGDERCVPPDDPRSNYRMAHQALLAHVPIPAENVHRMAGELDPSQAAATYSRELQVYFGAAHVDAPPAPQFDLILLGLGDDAHTASLFPATPALDEARRWVVPNWVPQLEMWRLTLTPPVLNAARHILFLVAGNSKAQPLANVLQGGHRPHEWPAQLVRPHSGQLTWLVDRPAAALLADSRSKDSV